MAHLTLAGVSDDGLRLRLVDGDGVEHTLDVDARLRDAVRTARARTGQQETTMDSALRPRDIQARIRAGETPEAVAEAAGTSVERIMPFAQPVLAEREHVADRAQRSSVRRRAGESAAPARTLGEAVAGQLRAHHVAPDTVAWDAWRREDGRWALSARFATEPRSGTARFAFDLPGNYVVAEDDDARWLVGDLPAGATDVAAPRDDLQQARRRRLAAVGEEQLPLGDDAIELVRTEDAEPPADDGEPVAAFLDDQPPGDADQELALREEAADAAAAEPEPEQAPAEPARRRAVRKSRGRASVPSWDEIMFGGGKPE